MGNHVPEEDAIFDVRAVADILGVNPGTIRRWASDHTLPGLKDDTSGKWRFTQQAILAFAKQHKPSRTLEASRAGVRYEVRFYHDEEYLIQTLSTYIAQSVSMQEGCLVIVTRDHAVRLGAALRNMPGFSLAAAAEKGTYLVLDAEQLLERTMVDGHFQNEKFMAEVGGFARQLATRAEYIRVFGELASLLWDKGNGDAMHALEERWSKISQNALLGTLRGLSMISFIDAKHASGFAIESDKYLSRSDIPEIKITGDAMTYARAIESLQQQTKDLQREINTRRGTVADLKRQLDELQAERQRLLQLNRAKDEFISIASHQLRTPATGVKQYISMILDGFFGEVSPQQMHALQKANESNERQLKVINDLLLIAKVDAGNIQLASSMQDLVDLVRDVIDEQRSVIAARNQTITVVAPDTLLATIDPPYMRMVIENLVSNASKYSADYTPITVTLRTASAGRPEVSVRDQGIGISEHDQTRLYRKFSRIYNDYSAIEGNGLGLYWSKKIVELHGGTLSLKSRPGHGSTFTITLPPHPLTK